MKILINYANETFRKAQKFNTWTGQNIAHFDDVIEYSEHDIDIDFKNKNSGLFSEKRGGGLWLWKPYIIMNALKKIPTDSFLFYCDSGSFFIQGIDALIHSMSKEDIWVSELPYVEYQWTKQEVFNALNANGAEITHTNQIQAGFLLLRKSERCVAFINKWLELCQESHLLIPEETKQDKCISNREDQSLLSVLCKLEGIKPHKDPTQFGKLPQKYKREDAVFLPCHYCGDEDYQPCIVLHRTKDVDFSISVKQYLCAVLPTRISSKLINKSSGRNWRTGTAIKSSILGILSESGEARNDRRDLDPNGN